MKPPIHSLGVPLGYYFLINQIFISRIYKSQAPNARIELSRVSDLDCHVATMGMTRQAMQHRTSYMQYVRSVSQRETRNGAQGLQIV